MVTIDLSDRLMNETSRRYVQNIHRRKQAHGGIKGLEDVDNKNDTFGLGLDLSIDLSEFKVEK